VVNALDVLRERGFVKQTTHEAPLRDFLSSRQVTAYVGLDPTADSLHVGHTLALMALAHLARAGHRPIALLGGGTALIGDPSGKTDMRQMMTTRQIQNNVSAIGRQVERFLGSGTNQALVLNNNDWLKECNYIDFLRDIGVHFSVNRMLTAECYKGRMEKGLSFIEFNYMLLQAFDYLHLYRHYGCRLQIGGDDQWSNIIAGADLIRRVEQVEAYGVTWPLITTASGAKMGKTEAGAVWLDPARTTPYEFYQYWRNTHDADVKNYLAMFTFLPMDEVNRLGALEDREINEAKEVLAWETTCLVHGEEAARAAREGARALFGSGESSAGVPTVAVSRTFLAAGVSVVDLIIKSGILSSKGEVKRLIQGGGLYINEMRVDSPEQTVNLEDLRDGVIVVRRGKKQYTHIKFE